MIPLPPLWADFDWVKLVVPLVMFAVWVFNRLMGGESPAAKQAKARQQARAKPPQPAAGERQRVEDEVGEFLRRAAQQRGAREPVAPPASPPPKPPKPLRKPLSADERRGNASQAAPTAAPTRAPELAPSIGTAIGSRIAQRSVQAVEVTQAEEAMESHLAEAFGHQVGTLGGETHPLDVVEAAPSPAAELAALLRDPRSVRDAVIVSEILRRPEERW